MKCVLPLIGTSVARYIGLLLPALIFLTSAKAQMPVVHDPSTVIRSGDRYYVFTTGKGAPMLSSPDGYAWTRIGSVFDRIPEDVRAGSPGNKGIDVWAPDVIKLNGQYFLYYAVSSWMSFVSAIGLATNPTLDPKDPAYKWTDQGIVVQSTPAEDLNAIDPGVTRAPNGSLWLSYGSYHGTIQIIELNSKTGLRLHPLVKATVIASRSESSDIIARNGYFYLFVNHGSCCQGRNSAYNLRVGRSNRITGPYLDRHGNDMVRGGGSLFLASTDHRIGPGHFGRVIEEDAETAQAERFSIHYEADLKNGGRPTLDIRPLLWSADGWPVAGDHLLEGTYVIRSAELEDVLDLNVDRPSATPPEALSDPHPSSPGTGVPVSEPPSQTPTAPQLPSIPKATTLRMSAYLVLGNQQWIVTPVADGYLKIVNSMTRDALEVSTEAASTSTVVSATYTGADNQLWQIDQLPDSTYRIRNKASRLTLAAPDSTVPGHQDLLRATTFKFDASHTWILATP